MTEAPTAPADTRVDALLERMTIEEKIGSLLVARIVTGADGALWEGTDGESPFGFSPTTELVRERHVTHVTLMNPAPVSELARWGQSIRELAASTRLGIPVSVASDPVHGRSRNRDVAMSGSGFTALPEPIALAARALGELGLPVLHLDYPHLEALAAEHMESEPAGPGFYHADEVETSMMLALAPESVRLDRARPEYPDFPPLFGSEPMKLSAFNRSGVFGDPRPATAQKGEALIAGIAAESTRLIGLWRAEHKL